MKSLTNGGGLNSILKRAEEGSALSDLEIVRLLEIVERPEIEALFAAARRVRDRHFSKKVFLYGFVYLSTYCRNDCHFCFYRASNSQSVRYRKNRQQIVEAAVSLARSNVHLIDLTMGEDPAYCDQAGFDSLAKIVTSVRETTGLPVMISPGLANERLLKIFKEAGVSWYACYQETHDRSLFRRIRPDQDFDSRLNSKRTAQKLGLLTEEGMLTGLGESAFDVARTLIAMGETETDQVRVMSFVPQRGTPLSESAAANPDVELKIISIMRLLFPDKLIPASLDIAGLRGLGERLNAGANVITSLIPPGEGLAGVAQRSLDIDDARRTVTGVEPVLVDCGLTPATKAEYRQWVEARQERTSGGKKGNAAEGGLD